MIKGRWQHAAVHRDNMATWTRAFVTVEEHGTQPRVRHKQDNMSAVGTAAAGTHHSKLKQVHSTRVLVVHLLQGTESEPYLGEPTVRVILHATSVPLLRFNGHAFRHLGGQRKEKTSVFCNSQPAPPLSAPKSCLRQRPRS